MELHHRADRNVNFIYAQFLWDERNKFKPPVEKGSLSSDMLFADYLEDWIKMAKSTIRVATYSSYS